MDSAYTLLKPYPIDKITTLQPLGSNRGSLMSYIQHMVQNHRALEGTWDERPDPGSRQTKLQTETMVKYPSGYG
jgi:hypothetical protein